MIQICLGGSGPCIVHFEHVKRFFVLDTRELHLLPFDLVMF